MVREPKPKHTLLEEKNSLTSSISSSSSSSGSSVENEKAVNGVAVAPTSAI